jgi:hypothetical protein
VSVDTFKPEVWSAVLLASLKKRLVFGSLVNRDYEGEIADYGDTVTINSVSRPTIGTYVPGTTTSRPSRGRPRRRSCSSTRRSTSPSRSTTSTPARRAAT